MKPVHKAIIREQLEQTLKSFSKVAEVQRPYKGWLRAVREALGMSGRQFADRLGVKPPRITALERDELSGAVTLKKMQVNAEQVTSTQSDLRIDMITNRYSVSSGSSILKRNSHKISDAGSYQTRQDLRKN